MLKELKTELRHLPKGLDRAHDGIAIPTRPCNSHTSTTSEGEASPQWGWYINTTPPTPEMYHSRPPKKRQVTSDDPPSIPNATIKSHSAVQPNKVFEDLQKKNRGKPMGWSIGVPL